MRLACGTVRPGVVPAASRCSNGPATVNLDIAFERTLPCGLCIGVHIPERDAWPPPEILAQLHPEEARHAAGLHPRRRPTWVAGRLALRATLDRLEIPAGPILPDSWGAPQLPQGVVGSISHKRSLAVGLACRPAGWTVGVDIEQPRMGSQDISRHVLTDSELAEIAGLAPEVRSERVMQRFSLKESIYKAIHPYVRRFVGFQEVSVTPLADGSARIDCYLKHGEILEIEGWWRHGQDHVLTCARARRA